MGRALASVGHELNNLVAVVQSYAAFIQESGADSAVVADAEVIRQSADKAASMARQLLAFGHPREREPEVLDLNALLSDVHGFLGRAFGAECQLEIVLAPEPVVVLAQRTLLGRLLLELALAAHELSASGSALQLGARSIDRAGVRCAELWLREQRPEGAPPTSAEPIAIGLDLSSMRRALAQHGGELESSFDAARGLEVSLILPTSGGLELAVDVAAPAESRPARGAETLLILEEKHELRAAACRALEAAGYRVLEAEDTETARALGLRGSVPVDLLLASRADGELQALSAELRALHPSLGVLERERSWSNAQLQGAVRARLDERRRWSAQVPVDASRVVALVVDDDEHVRLALSRILDDVGADVLTAPSGLHALQTLQALPVDLLIADQLMPGMEGTRLLETAYKTWPRIVRVVYTGYLSSGLIVDAVNRASVHKVLAKDMSPEWLRQQLSEVVAEIRRTRGGRAADG